MAPTYQSLYRRFRPQRFDEVAGQEHVTRALRAAVASETAGHAYLFSGPRGTGKTSTARILAKALNCFNPHDGEPCLDCESCRAIAQGSSDDVEELDAASNSGVDAIRWLIQTVSTSSTGRWKVYIIDEVHMLSTAAANALLKTLEEPPRHVVFILATTNPQKVLPTVVSRTQHFEFHLLEDESIGEVVDEVVAKIGVDLDPKIRSWVMRRGGGSARDTLSVLEQVLAGGQAVPEVVDEVDSLVERLLELDEVGLVSGVERLLMEGNDPLWLMTEMIKLLKDQFVAGLGSERGAYPLPRITRAMETLGRLAVGVRDSLDPGAVLEAVLVQLIEELRNSAGIEERLSRLEREVAGIKASTGPATAAPGDRQTSQRDELSRLRGAISRGGDRTRAAEKSGFTVPTPRPVQPEPDPAPAPLTADRSGDGLPERDTIEHPQEPGADPAPGPLESPFQFDGDKTEHLRLRIQSEWLGRVVPAMEPKVARTWIRDTRVASIGPSQLAIVLDHRTRMQKLDPYLAQIKATLESLYGGGFSVVLMLENEMRGPGSKEALQAEENSESEEFETQVEGAEEHLSVPTERLTEEVIISNVTEVFPGARMIQGEL